MTQLDHVPCSSSRGEVLLTCFDHVCGVGSMDLMELICAGWKRFLDYSELGGMVQEEALEQLRSRVKYLC